MAFRLRCAVTVMSRATVTSRSTAAANPSRPSALSLMSAQPSLTSISPTGRETWPPVSNDSRTASPGRAASAARRTGMVLGGSVDVSRRSSSAETTTRSARLATSSRRSTLSSSRISGSNARTLRSTDGGAARSIRSSGCRTLSLAPLRAASPARSTRRAASMSASRAGCQSAWSGSGKRMRWMLGAASVDVLGHEGHDRGEELAHPHQHVIEDLIGCLLLAIERALPELAAPPPHVPVGQVVVDEQIDGGDGPADLIGVEGRSHLRDRGLEAAEQPLLEGSGMRGNALGRLQGGPVEVRVGDEHGIHVPEGQEPSLHLAGTLEPEADRVRR